MDNGVGRLWRCLDNAIAMHEFLMASGENVLVADVTGDGVSFEHRDRVFRLDSATKEALERAFDADFSMVNIHLGPDADRLTAEYEAAAVTIGNEIYFAAGNYAPDTETGAALLRHELQHVVQFQRRMPMVYAEDIVDLEAEAIYIASLSADRESEQRVGEMATTGTIFERSDGGGGQTALTKKRGGDSGGATLNDFRRANNAERMIVYRAENGKRYRLTQAEYRRMIQDAAKLVGEWIDERRYAMTEAGYAEFVLKTTERIQRLAR